MPETRFTIRWPDGRTDDCYSPSSVVQDFLSAGESYPLADFVVRCRIALEKASTRVEAKYGFRCTSAEAQLSQIERQARRYSEPADVTCLSII